MEQLQELLRIPSPSGYTDQVVTYVKSQLDELGLEVELTRRGAIRAVLRGRDETIQRAVVGHLDTLGCIVKSLKENGRIELLPIGFWSARFAEGARVTLLADTGRSYRGTIVPLKASGHVYNEEIDQMPVGWGYVELRLDERVHSPGDLMALGIHVGDHVAVDSAPEITDSGYICARHLDDKAAVAAMLTAARAVAQSGRKPPTTIYLLFTISEEVGVGASHVLHGDASELVSVDNGTMAPGQNTCEFGVTIAMMDSSGPFDYHLSRHMATLCREFAIEHSRDVFRYYRSDAAAALEAGNDIRTALVCFGLDASHGHERVHADSLAALAKLLYAYITTPPAKPLT
ncbi:osmoprotectant NAGGN system M42 family peptidase [Magnetofaba australis]|uniref:Putative peptidase M42 family protein n=1 Tax=Magnetofaba australis IT-1 TaxID=1434232 RepID=A0A1Y2K564_9PROT|nr:osmoprotectant NAGGN system M42 family peptidase [Magnetofaba australis]OSM02264.1 putative peptidase M42 family protein [Magnetofaba australis IT-1]